MQVKHLRIERFRGIRELDWSVGGGFICLIGPGDSTKSTILDAIDFALSSG
jgi:predicted ATP-dependent endonuclease of OLD family